MLYPDNRIQPVTQSADYAEVTPKSPISATFKVAPGLSDMLSGYARRQAAERNTTLPEAVAAEPLPYSGKERRKLSRRIHQADGMLDTRSGRDRRKFQTTPDGKPLNINDEA
jgi:hypothetical protein